MYSLLRLLAIYALLITASFIGLVLGGSLFAILTIWFPESIWVKGILLVVLALAGGVATFKFHASATRELKERLLDTGSVFSRNRLSLYGEFAAMGFAFCWAIGAVVGLVSLNG
jgi:hypothetical protein